MADDAAAKSSPAAAADRIRETAKWLTVSLAGLGGVLIAGSQLSDVGALAIGSFRFWLSVAGGAFGILGTVAILALAIWIATKPAPPYARLVKEDTRHPANAALASDPYRLGGWKKIEELDARRTATLKARNKAETDYDEAPDGPAKEQKAGALVDKNKDFVYMDTLARHVNELAGYEVLSWRWRRVGGWMIGAGVLAALGLGVFAWAANPPPDATASVVNPTVLTTPTAGTLTLTDAGQQALSGKLGCPAGVPLDVLRLGNTDAGTDVLIQASGCEPLRFVVVPAWGSVTTAPVS